MLLIFCDFMNFLFLLFNFTLFLHYLLQYWFNLCCLLHLVFAVTVSYWSDSRAVSQCFLMDFTLKPRCNTIRLSLVLTPAHPPFSLPWTLIQCFSAFFLFGNFVCLNLLHICAGHPPHSVFLSPHFQFQPSCYLSHFLYSSQCWVLCSLTSLLQCDVYWVWVLFSDRYIDDLVKLKAQTSAEGNEFITWNDIQSCVDHVNKVVHEEHESEFFCSTHARLIIAYKEC